MYGHECYDELFDILQLVTAVFIPFPLLLFFAQSCYIKNNQQPQVTFFEGCEIGFHGPLCDLACRYPSYGKLCQSVCYCQKMDCHHSHGCRKATEGAYMKRFTLTFVF